jgi:hypothetical protein
MTLCWYSPRATRGRCLYTHNLIVDHIATLGIKNSYFHLKRKCEIFILFLYFTKRYYVDKCLRGSSAVDGGCVGAAAAVAVAVASLRCCCGHYRRRLGLLLGAVDFVAYFLYVPVL